MDPTVVWLPSTLIALVLYGVGQGLVKQFISEVAPARYCLYFFFTKSVVNLSFWWWNGHPTPIDGGLAPFLMGTLAYVLEGLGWICYYESIVAGPISIVGTLSAAYAAPTVLFAYLFLGETLGARQYFGVFLVILGCAGLSYAPPDPEAKTNPKKWVPLALAALALWGLWQTLVKHTYNTHKTAEAVMVLYNICGAFLTLGLYGLIFGLKADAPSREWVRSLVPMAMMAGGDLGVIIATATGPVAVVTPLSGAYPLVTLGYAATVLKEKVTRLQWCCIALVLVGMILSPPEPSSEAPPAPAAQASPKPSPQGGL